MSGFAHSHHLVCIELVRFGCRHTHHLVCRANTTEMTSAEAAGASPELSSAAYILEQRIAILWLHMPP